MRDGSSRYLITPTDDSGARLVAFLSAGSWANYPNDDRAKQNEDRIVQLEGAPLPDWAVRWLTNANAKQCDRARSAFRSAVEQAGFDADLRDAQNY